MGFVAVSQKITNSSSVGSDGRSYAGVCSVLAALERDVLVNNVRTL